MAFVPEESSSQVRTVDEKLAQTDQSYRHGSSISLHETTLNDCQPKPYPRGVNTELANVTDPQTFDYLKRLRAFVRSYSLCTFSPRDRNERRYRLNLSLGNRHGYADHLFLAEKLRADEDFYSQRRIAERRILDAISLFECSAHTLRIEAKERSNANRILLDNGNISNMRAGVEEHALSVVETRRAKTALLHFGVSRIKELKALRVAADLRLKADEKEFRCLQREVVKLAEPLEALRRDVEGLEKDASEFSETIRPALITEKERHGALKDEVRKLELHLEILIQQLATDDCGFSEASTRP